MANKPQIKPKEEKIVIAMYAPADTEKKVWDEYQARKSELKNSRKNVNGLDIDEQMRSWDRDYFERTAKIPASELDTDQSPIAVNNAFSQVQTALSILVGRNPDFVLDERMEKYSGNNQLIRALLKKSWQRTDSMYQFILSVHNMAKRGWFVGRTFHRDIKTQGQFRVGVDKDGKDIWEEREVRKLDDVVYQNLDNHNVWIDEESRPYDYWSTRDWMWREVWHIDKVRRVFPEAEFPNMKFVTEGGVTAETPDGTAQTDSVSATSTQQRELKEGATELYFYENQYDDRLIVDIHGVMVVWEPLPQHHKRLSLVTGFWNIRNAETIYGIGLIEMMEKDETLIDRINNMDLRQLLLSINPPGFYNGGEDFENENLKLKAGVLRRVNGDPKNIQFVTIPKPDNTGIDRVERLENKEEQRSGITKQLGGDISQIKGETAFALGISREAGLKKLRLPLKSLQYAFSWEARNRIDVIRQVYSDFDVEHLVDEKVIQQYLEEVKADPKFFFIKNEGSGGAKEEFFANRFPEEQLELEEDDKGKFIESEEKKFFKIRPEMLAWEGDIWIDIDSILVHSEELEKLDTIRMTKTIAELIQLPPEIAKMFIKQVLLAFNKDPKQWMPENFIESMQQQGEGEGSPIKTQPVEGQGKSSLGGRMGQAFNALAGRSGEV